MLSGNHFVTPARLDGILKSIGFKVGQDKFKDIAHAYGILSDNEKRKQYRIHEGTPENFKNESGEKGMLFR